MKICRWLFLAVMLLLLFSCDMFLKKDESELIYDSAPPLTVTIRDLPSSPFSPGTTLYIRFKEAQGNAPVAAGGTAVIGLHLPTGIPYKAVQTKAYGSVSILNNNKVDTTLYITYQTVEIAQFTANINLSFSDFVVAP
ncbi:MAG: hypothetical protein LBS57_07305 [Treponema sp.]|jgi:hypothetical protein|nr:hypothetical protein [Treponema sp.]